MINESLLFDGNIPELCIHPVKLCYLIFIEPKLKTSSEKMKKLCKQLAYWDVMMQIDTCS